MDNLGDRSLIIFLSIFNVLLMIITIMNIYYFTKISYNNTSMIFNYILLGLEIVIFFLLLYLIYAQFKDQQEANELMEEQQTLKTTNITEKQIATEIKSIVKQMPSASPVNNSKEKDLTIAEQKQEIENLTESLKQEINFNIKEDQQNESNTFLKLKPWKG